MMVKVVLGVFALVALGMGGVFTWIGVSSQREATRLPGLRRLGPADFVDANVGLAGYVEGDLSAANPTLYQDLVLYFRSRLQGFTKRSHQGVLDTTDRQPVWQPLDRKTPPVKIDSGETRVLAFGSYSVTFKGSDPSLLTTAGLEAGVTEKYEGLYVGQRVTAIGKVGFAAEVPGLDTETLASGTFEETLAGSQSSARFGLIAGTAMLLVGLVLAVLAITV